MLYFVPELAGLQGGLGVTPQQITTPIGGALLSVGSKLVVANPLVGGIIAGAGLLTTLIGGLFKPDLTKIEATRIVNDIESQVLQPNLRAWQNAPFEQKTLEAQQHAEAVFNQAWGAVMQGCSNPQLGQAGYNCIHDRERGSTKGYDWFRLYYDPIANDKVYTPPLASQTGINQVIGGNFTALDSAVSSAVSNVDWKKLIIPAVLLGGVIYFAGDF